MDGVVVQAAVTSLSSALSVVKSNPAWDNRMSLGVLCPFYVYTDPRDTGYIPNVDVVTVISKKHYNYKISEFYND